jgi:hypothetical protein
MGILKSLKSFFVPGLQDSSGPPRLSAGSASELSASLRVLPAGERGWITIPEARHLFSVKGDQYAFGDMDDQGKANLAAFAGQVEHRCTFDFMPVEGRVYFTRIATSKDR